MHGRCAARLSLRDPRLNRANNLKPRGSRWSAALTPRPLVHAAQISNGLKVRATKVLRCARDLPLRDERVLSATHPDLTSPAPVAPSLAEEARQLAPLAPVRSTGPERPELDLRNRSGVIFPRWSAPTACATARQKPAKERPMVGKYLLSTIGLVSLCLPTGCAPEGTDSAGENVFVHNPKTGGIAEDVFVPNPLCTMPLRGILKWGCRAARR